MKRNRFRRWRVAGLLGAVLLAIGVPSAVAVHDFDPPAGDNDLFELDNDAIDQAEIPGVNFAGDDWSTTLFGGGSAALDSTTGLLTDVFNANDDTFCQGTKEIDDLGAWRWCDNTAANDKNDLEHAYAAIYIVPDGFEDEGHRILYVGADRFANNGDSGLGFMFLQSGLAKNACPSHTGCTFNDGQVPAGTPAHVNGDVYVVTQFTGGGQDTTVDFYIWNNGAWVLDTTGVDCDDATANDVACGTVFGDGLNSTNLTTEAPWAYTTKFPGLLNGVPQPNDFAEGTFFEGGVDLTARGISGCFQTILVDTSQSQRINESAQDFILSSVGECGSELTTTPADGSGTALTDTDVPPNGLPDVVIGLGSAGVDVTDQADLDVTGADTWTGTIDFYLCGPIVSGTCDSGGVLVESRAVDQTTVFPITSASAHLTSVGRYCWFGNFTSPTAGVPDASDATEGECFEVKPVTPTLSTTAWSTGDDTGSAQTDPVPFGEPLFDKADLDGTAFQPGTDGTNLTYPSINATMVTPANGSITFTLVGPDGELLDCTTVATGVGLNPETVDVSGDGDYFTSGFTPDSPGDFHWKASYSGDSPNTLDATHNDECDEVGEDVTVEQVPTEISTRQRVYPNDAARIASSEAGDNLPAGGTVTFRLYGPDGGNTALANCLAHGETLGSGGLLYVEPVTVTGGANFETVSTNNTTVPVVASETYYWWVTYDTGDSAHTGSQSDCVENVSLTFTNDPGPGTLFPPAS